MSTLNSSILQIKDVTKVFKLGGLLFGSELSAVDHVSLEVGREKVLSLVGESGSGKTTLSRIILGLIEPTNGQILYEDLDIRNAKGRQLRRFRKEVQPIFQNPFETFNPFKRVDRYLLGSALGYKVANSKSEARRIVSEALDIVGLSYTMVEGQFPHEFSGGELQRVSIARALVTNPRLLIADEPVSMIDASTRMGILNILMDLRKRFSMSIVYITHDLDTAYYVSDQIAVMCRGCVVECGDVEDVLTDPVHPYTQMLLKCLPEPDPTRRWEGHIELAGLEVKEYETAGCKFSKRCPNSEDKCLKERPPDVEVESRSGYRFVKCWKCVREGV
ncbi:MAG: ABC transporter ATP-binding protein [Candidatus Bathyarchaeota archaeon]|nr:MAG: ABC transporter ATP-binding protein [Candidatus Bathyarchaeota archaeon]